MYLWLQQRADSHLLIHALIILYNNVNHLSRSTLNIWTIWGLFSKILILKYQKDFWYRLYLLIPNKDVKFQVFPPFSAFACFGSTLYAGNCFVSQTYLLCFQIMFLDKFSINLKYWFDSLSNHAPFSMLCGHLWSTAEFTHPYFRALFPWQSFRL